jgi:hypothetical protein
VRVLPALAAAVVLTLASLYTPAAARANGRFPKAQAIVTPPGDDATIYLRATFGVLVSRDSGKTWHWLCEQQLGFASAWDPPIAATRDGRLWVALQDGARVTRDGCKVDAIPSLEGETVVDLTVDGTGDHVIAITSAPGKPAFVWRAGSAGDFTRLGEGLAGFRLDTVEVAPSRASRLYATGLPEQPGKRAHIFRSDDGGATLSELSPSLATDGRLFVAAVDPKDPDRVLVRELSSTGSDVLLSTDGGKSFASVLHMKGAMLGFTRAPDGSAYYAGGGDPKEGIWRSDDRGATWLQGAKTSVFCLHADASRLLVCSNPYVPQGYAVAESTDRGMTIKMLATFDDVAGPVPCDGGSAESKCDAPWPDVRALIATSAHVKDPSYSVGLDASAPGNADAAVTPATTPARSHGSACGCRVCGQPASPRNAFAALLLAAVAILGSAVRRAHAGSFASQRHEKSDHRRTGML